MSLACRLGPIQAHTYENEMITFTIPSAWQTTEEFPYHSVSPEKGYYGLGVQELVLIQYQGQGKAFFAVAAAPLANGEDLETRFTQAYQMAMPEIENASQQLFEQGELSGYEITYKRPWGEPWWQFRDIWLEKDAVVYVLSFRTAPDSFDTYSDPFDQILESFRFKE